MYRYAVPGGRIPCASGLGSIRRLVVNFGSCQAGFETCTNSKVQISQCSKVLACVLVIDSLFALLDRAEETKCRVVALVCMGQTCALHLSCFALELAFEKRKEMQRRDDNSHENAALLWFWPAESGPEIYDVEVRKITTSSGRRSIF